MPSQHASIFQERTKRLKVTACAFCGSVLTRRNRSKEHIWADWLRNYVPKTFSNTGHFTSISAINVDTGKLLTMEQLGELHRPGDPHSQRLAIVCKSCNEGWMGTLQKSAKGYLVPFLNKEWPDIIPEAQKHIASWATMFTMVVEFADKWTMSTPQIEREKFRSTKTPGENWFIWLGRYQGEKWKGAFNHFGLGGDYISIEISQKIQIPDSLNPMHYAQSTAFSLGSLFFMTFSTRRPQTIINPIEFPERFAAHNGLTNIWPATGKTITAPIRVLDDITADEISRQFLPPADRDRVRPVGGGL